MPYLSPRAAWAAARRGNLGGTLSGFPILIFDEATSTLDYESERVIQNNMALICRNRTVIIIAHQLSAVRTTNRIIAIDRGVIVEEGAHQELVVKESSYYAHLFSMQAG